MVTLRPFTVSAAAIIERARDLFVSEDFQSAIELIQMNREQPLSQEALMSFFMGDVTLDDNLDVIDGVDEEYKQLVSEILENYDLLYKMPEESEIAYLQAYKHFAFHFAENRGFTEQFFNKKINQVVLRNGLYPEIIKNIENSIEYLRRNGFSGCHDFANCDALIYTGEQLIFLKEFDGTFYKEFSKVYETPEQLIARLDEIEASYQ